MSDEINGRDGSDSTYSRLQRVQGVDEDAGTFGMTLATEGEASDGHILSIEGGTIPARMPLLVSHGNDPFTAAGSITRARKHLSESPARLSAVGEVEMDGAGGPAEIRRDLMHMVARGHIPAVSIRWDFDAKDAVRRTDLPSDHPHYINPEREKSWAKREGLYFKKWRALEGSIVAIGADPLALIGRADQTEGEVSSFWRSFAATAKPEGEVEAAKPPSRESLIVTFAALLREYHEQHGFSLDELASELEALRPPEPPAVETLQAQIRALTEEVVALKGRVIEAPAPSPLRPRDLIESLRAALAHDRAEAMEKFRASLREISGKVD